MISINTSKIWAIIWMIGFFEPVGVSGMRTYIGGVWRYVHYIFLLMRIVSILAIALSYLRNSQYIKMSVMTVAVAIYALVMCLIDFINFNDGIINTIWIMVSCLCLVMWVEYYTVNNQLTVLVDAIDTILLVVIVINLISIFWYPEGIYINTNGWTTNWFMGYKNNFVYMYIPFMLTRSVLDLQRKRFLSIKTIIGSSCMLISSITVGADTTSVIVILFIFLYICVMKNKLVPNIGLYWSIFVSMVLSVFIIGFGFLEFFSPMIQDLFSKDSTASNRIYIWAAGLESFSKNPIFGTGNTAEINYNGMRFSMTQYHNKYLDLLCVGGIIILVLWIAIIIIAGRRLKISELHEVNTVFLFIMLCYGVLFLMEAARDDIYFIFVLSLAYSIKAMFTTDSLQIDQRIKHTGLRRISIKLSH